MEEETGLRSLFISNKSGINVLSIPALRVGNAWNGAAMNLSARIKV
jgi:hypothetical protein